MIHLQDKQVLVIGLGGRGCAACALLQRNGARVVAVDNADTPELRATATLLRQEGARVEIGVSAAPDEKFDFAVVSPAVPADSPWFAELSRREIPVIGELELGFQQCQCLTIAVAGTNGKGSTAEIIEQVLGANHRKTALAGHGLRPVCSVADRTRELDYLILQVNAFQLETIRFFRPAVAVLLNLAPDHLDRYADEARYVQAYARLFQNQQSFDWAIVETEALAQLKKLNLLPQSKIVTFSARDQNSDIYLDRGLVISRLGNWNGPLLDTAQCRMRGMHHAENFMAALAVGHALRLPLASMVEALKNHAAGPHRFEFVAESQGVQFVNDSKATNVEALRGALQSAKFVPGGSPNVWLIAGGRDQGQDFHSVSPEISRRVKGAFLIGEAQEKIRAAWGLFTPCTMCKSLLEAITEAAKNAAAGDVILLSPACSSFDQFQNYQQRGEKFSQAVNQLVGVRQAPTPI